MSDDLLKPPGLAPSPLSDDAPLPPPRAPMPAAAPVPSAPRPAAPMPPPGFAAPMPASMPPPGMPPSMPPPPPARAMPPPPPAGVAMPPPPPPGMPPIPPPPAGVAMPPPPPPGMPPIPPPPAGLAMPPPPPAGMPPMPAMPAAAPAPSSTSAPARGIRNMDAICVDVVRRTPDSATLYFFVGDHGGYKAGQFVSIDPKQFPELARWCEFYKKLKGKPEGVRAYSMSSIPSEKYISITVKAEPYDPANNDYPPLLSPFLASGALKGRELVLRGFSGPYTLPDDHAQKTTQIVHFVAGSGVVPNYAILKDELKRPENARVKHTFIDVNKTYDDIIFREQLDALARAYPDRMELVHLITRDENPERYGPHFHKGRPTLEFVKRYVQDPKTAYVYSCGPAITKYEKEKAKKDGTTPKPRFIESVEEIVHGLGIAHDRFKKEEFG